MKPNKPNAKCNREIFIQTSERIFKPSCQLVSMTFLQTSRNEHIRRYRQKQCRQMPFQTKKKIKSSQVKNAVR